ncbi:MAG: hypothetical protein RQ754_06560 [Desulfuromonadales bacterium]|nr:hypothetical protein [Desulfuromonadales bacterium]
MTIILFIPLGLLCLVISLLGLRRNHKRHAIVCALMGLFFLGVAALLSYGTSLLIDNLPPLS